MENLESATPENVVTRFINLLKWGYIEEHLVSTRVFSMLTAENEEYSEDLFQLLSDSEHHKIILENILRQMGYEIHYPIKKHEFEIYKAMKFFETCETRRLSDLEYQAYLLYREHIKFFDEKLKQFYLRDVSEEILNSLSKLAEDELKHYRIAKKIESNID